MTGSMLYTYVQSLAEGKGYQLAEWHCGHLLGVFPHEKRMGEDPVNYICPENNVPMNRLAGNGEKRFWILEVHLTRADQQFGGFIEDLLIAKN
jgi:Xaa-Pro dipeptidase